MNRRFPTLPIAGFFAAVLLHAAENSFAQGAWVLKPAQSEFGAGPFRPRSETLRIGKAPDAEFVLRVDGEDFNGGKYNELWRGAADGALREAEDDFPMRAAFEWDGRDLLMVEKFGDQVARIRASFSTDGKTMTAAWLNRNGETIATWVYKKQ